MITQPLIDALDDWRKANVLSDADVQLAAQLCVLGDETDGDVALATALAARAPRFGHICIDINTVQQSLRAEVEENDSDNDQLFSLLQWPPAKQWIATLKNSSLVKVVTEGEVLPSDNTAPLVLWGSLLYLARYYDYECRVAQHLLARSQSPTSLETGRIDEICAVLEPDEDQKAAALLALQSPFSVLLGGPGTGKTRSVATLLALLFDQSSTPLQVALAAPTGKAAARLNESIKRDGAALSESSLADAERLGAAITSIEADTVHKLIGASPLRATPRYNAQHQLPHDVVIIDESSMVSLPLISQVFEAVRPEAKIVLVGDPGQLASVAAGSVLSDIAGENSQLTGPLRAKQTTLKKNHRFQSNSGIGEFAKAIRLGDADAAIEILKAHEFSPGQSSEADLQWINQSATSPEIESTVHALMYPLATQVAKAAEQGNGQEALALMQTQRMLCAHRLGNFGVARWNRVFEKWISPNATRSFESYAGRVVMVTRNDHARGIFNGDMGVEIVDPETKQIKVALPPRRVDTTDVQLLSPAQFDQLDTAFAITIHKSQGSEFDHVVVIMPPHKSRLATRELLYTAVTRASKKVTLIGTDESVRTAVSSAVQRASGLPQRLWQVG